MSNELEIYSSEFVMTTHVKAQEFIVYGLIYPGLYILAGSPKIGKSWFALDLCFCIANGEKFLKRDTNSGQVLYLSLEDNFSRLQNRIYELTAEPCENLNFSINADKIGHGLEQQLESCKKQLKDLKLIVIDTLQKIRASTDVNYGTDYKDLSALKSLADKLNIAILLIHHTRKCYDSDPFNMVSGTTGIIGSVDGIMVMSEEKRGSKKAKLYCSGRDIESMELEIEFHGHRWKAVKDAPDRKPNLFPQMIHDLMLKHQWFKGSATELCKLMNECFHQEFFPNHVSRNLVQNTEKLKEYGVNFSYGRSHGIRFIKLEYNESGDSSDGKLLYCEKV